MASEEKETGTQYKVKEDVDRDAQDMVIASLRTQIQDLISQVSQLNGKLVKSYDRVSDLEDDLHVASSSLRSSSQKIAQLESERTQHLAALNTGLLVEKSHVTAELTRLMEKATEEAAQRGQAESARIEIEKDLDDLSANLFNQANTMVAEARYEKHLSERKVEEAERTLKGAEEAVQLMQTQMQALQAEKEEAEAKAREMEIRMVDKPAQLRQQQRVVNASLRLLSIHTPFQDYLAFLSHLRLLHLTSPNPPAMSTLLPLPFLTRLLNEDSEPTIRLDLAPSLNWLSRRSVLAAIHAGHLTIEPISSIALLTESSLYPTSSISGLSSNGDHLSCALCGTSIFPPPLPPSSDTHAHSTNTHDSSGSPHPSRQPSLPLFGGGSGGGAATSTGSVSASTHATTRQSISWSPGTFFKRASASSIHQPQPHTNNDSSVPPSPTANGTTPTAPVPHNPYQNLPPQIFIFKVSTPNTSSSLPTIPSLMMSKSHSSHSHNYGGSSLSPLSSHPSSTLVPPALSHSHSAHHHSSSSTTTANGLSLITPTASSSSSSSSVLGGASPASSSSSTTIYPLCSSGWCLARLRTTCTLWAFVRTGIVDRIWEEEVIAASTTTSSVSGVAASSATVNGKTAVDGSAGSGVAQAQVPPPPPKKRGIWSIASAIGIGGGDKKASGGSASAPATTPTPAATIPAVPVTTDGDAKALPPAPATEKTAVPPALPARRVPPPVPSASLEGVAATAVSSTAVDEGKKDATITATAPVVAGANAPPPPLPKRSDGRGRRPSPQLPEEKEKDHDASTSSTTATPEPAPAPVTAPMEVPSASATPRTPPLVPSRRGTPTTPATPTPVGTGASSSRANSTTRPTTPSTSPGRPLPSTSPSATTAAQRRISADLGSGSKSHSRPSSPSPTRNPNNNTSTPIPTTPPRSPHHRPASPSVLSGNMGKRASLGKRMSMAAVAANVPLPESRPGTPGAPMGGSRPGTPSNVGSGAAAGAPAVPPPVPRRAAARGAAGGTGTPGRVGTPTLPSQNTSAPPLPPPPAAPVVLEMVDESDMVADGDSGAKPEAKEAEKEEKEAEKEKKNAEGVDTTTASLPLAMAPVPSQGATSDGDVFVDAEDSMNAPTPPPVVPPAGDVKVDGVVKVDGLKRDVEEVEPEKEKENAGDVDEKEAEGTKEEVQGEAEKGTETKEDAREPAEEVRHDLVGESTWEEKTWREIVRLREDMFWARVGALRD